MQTQNVETQTVELTSAIMIDGQIRTAGSVVEVEAAVAHNLLARGKAVAADVVRPGQRKAAKA